LKTGSSDNDDTNKNFNPYSDVIIYW
jgi:hypothetical protein